MKQSIVLRGSITTKNNVTYISDVVNHLRTWFDGELILSTWDYEKKNIPDGLNIDKIIYSSDPGGGPVGNLKRQILSQKLGVEASSGDIILCSRTDIIFTKDIFKEYVEHEYKNINYKIFNNRILTCSHMTIDVDNYNHCEYDGRIFRISDWLHLGYREDIIKLTDILDVIDGLNHDDIRLDNWYRYKNCNCCEQFWGLCLIHKNITNIEFCNLEPIKNNHYDYMCNNFIIKNTVSGLGVINKTWEFQPDDLTFYMTYDKFLNRLNLQTL